MAEFTILGGSGFIGSRLAAVLSERGVEVATPPREASLRGVHLGHVVYAIGITADFRSRLLDTIDAHACRLAAVLRESEYASFTYLSSTRLYGGRTGRAREDDALEVRPSDADHIYNISKALGEAATLAAQGRTRVVRLSNVYGLDTESDNFLSSVIRSAVAKGHVAVRTSRDSAKDYVSVDDVVRVIPDIALRGRFDTYNIASGANTTNREILDVVGAVTGCSVSYDPEAPSLVFPTIDVTRVTDEFGFRPRNVLEDLPGLVTQYAERL